MSYYIIFENKETIECLYNKFVFTGKGILSFNCHINDNIPLLYNTSCSNSQPSVILTNNIIYTNYCNIPYNDENINHLLENINKTVSIELIERTGFYERVLFSLVSLVLISIPIIFIVIMLKKCSTNNTNTAIISIQPINNNNRLQNILIEKQIEFNASEDIEYDCSICLEPLKKEELLIKLQCDHVFHKDCIDEWIEKNHKCPNCNRSTLRNNNAQEEELIVESQEDR